MTPKVRELAHAAESFRRSMVESGATSKVSQDYVFPYIRRLEAALASLGIDGETVLTDGTN